MRNFHDNRFVNYVIYDILYIIFSYQYSNNIFFADCAGIIFGSIFKQYEKEHNIFSKNRKDLVL